MRKLAEKLRQNIEKLEKMEEDFPGQITERRLQMTIEAVMESDIILMEGSDGSEEETDFLTSAVALKWAEKAHQAHMRRLLKHQLGVRHESP